MDQALLEQSCPAAIVLRMNQHPISHGNGAEMHFEAATEVGAAPMTLEHRQADNNRRLVQETVNCDWFCDRPRRIPDKDKLVRIREIARQNGHTTLRELVEGTELPYVVFRKKARAKLRPMHVEKASLTHPGALQLSGHCNDELWIGGYWVG